MVEDATLVNTGSLMPQPNHGMPTAKLVSRRDISEDLIVIRLEPQDGPFTFKPSQYCTLGLDGIERNWRYSWNWFPKEN